MAPSPEDVVMLLIGDDNFANFASPGAPESSRLYVQLNGAEETLYLGLSREFTDSGSPASTGSYSFRIRRASDDQIVHGPFSVNSFVENISSWEEAVGPAILNGGVGYATDDNRYVFAPGEAGLYYIEFISADYIGYWDFTVAANGAEIPGRVYSKNWAFRTPTVGNTQPECVWDREFNGALYSYTSDGFVTRIDFADSGFQGLSFTMAFNTSGPGQTGDLGQDRMSIPGSAPGDDFAEHLIFLSEPDPVVYPSGECGDLTVAPYFSCTGPGTYCLEVEVTQPGQVEVVIDVNQNNAYDEGVDRRILHRFDEGAALNACLDWDGLLGDGTPIAPGSSVNLLVQYTQGVQHWTVFDGEFLKEGFCVEPIRPMCPASNGSTDILYWDDRNIEEAPGTGQPKDGRIGCDCETPACRTWNNFDPQTDDCSDIEDSQTTGYGDKNSLNTWWFANVVSESIANIPLISVSLEGETEVCQGQSTTLSYTFTSSDELVNIIWTGPEGVIAEGPDAPSEIEISLPGTYTVELINEDGCSFSDSHVLAQAICPTDLELDITANDLNPNMWQTVTFTITVTNQGPHDAGDFTVNTSWPEGITNVQVLTPGGTINGSSIDWENLSLEVGESLTLVFTGRVTPALDHTVEAEITYSAQGDLDSTPGNGVDTNGNGQCADDVGDEDDGDCVELIPPPCEVTATVSNIACFDNLTPDDPTDDSFRFTLLVTSAYGGGAWTGDINGQTISGNYGLSVTYSGYDILDGNLLVTINDGIFGEDCSTVVVVEPPAPCSSDCVILIETEDSLCDNEGTSFDPSDDTYDIRFRVIGINTSDSWTASDGSTGAYDVWYTYEDFAIEDGDVSLTFTDNGEGGCSASQTFTAPETCSSDCLLEAFVGAAVCNNNGTPSNHDDDTFYFTVEVNGWNLGGTNWAANDPNNSSGAYGTSIELGPYPISAGNLDFVIFDPTNPDCSVPVSVIAPNTCSDVCALTLQESFTDCQNNGTESDPSDDTFTVLIRITGANASSGWTASNGQNGDYGEWVTMGPFPIADGDVTIDFEDNEIPGCGLSATFEASTTCSSTCSIAATATEPVCDPQGTPSDPSDDTYSFFLTVEGSNTGAGWNANDPLSSGGSYGEAVLMGPYPIADGGFTLTITDDAEGTCTTVLIIEAPATCSDECAITTELVAGSVACDDNETPSDPSDDFFTYTVVVTGFNTSGSWMASNGQEGNYNEPTVMGPFSIADGTAIVTYVDAGDDACTSSLTVDAPPTCSDQCEILEAAYTDVQCDDNGTPTDPSDDTYTFQVILSGANTATSWTANDGTNGAYNEAVSFGPYDISSGDVTLSFIDDADEECTAELTIPAPETCSDQCLITASASNYQCDDNNTPFDPEDDLFTFDLTVEAVNNAGPGWIQPSGNNGEYGVAYTQGPFLIADGPFNMVVEDVADASCTASVVINPPPACSDDCMLFVEVEATYCDDNGTPEDTSDDEFTYALLVTGVNTGDSWIASDGTIGSYGEVVESTVGHEYADGLLQLIVQDRDGACADTVEISAPAPALFCPDDTDQREFLANLQVIQGDLGGDDQLLEEAPCFLALSSTPILLGDRFMEPVDFDTPEGPFIDTTDVYNFFFFTDIPLDPALAGFGNADGTGMIFRGDYSSYDDPCCFTENYAANVGDATDMSDLPLLIDTTGMFDQPMYLVQYFSQVLRLGEEYSLVASTYSSGVSGNYAWVVVSDQGEPLTINSTAVTSEFYPESTISEDLTYFHIPWAQDDEESVDHLGYVIFEPLCGVDTLYFADQLERDDNCEDSYITRTFTMEYGGQLDSCDQEITFRRPNIDDLILPPSTVTFQCGDDYELNENGYPHPLETGYPIVSNGADYDTLIEQTPYFNLGVSYKDIPNPDTTDFALDLIREWNIVDECNGDTLYVIPQRIKVGDFGPPRLVCPTSSGPCSCPDDNILLFGLDSLSCTATVDVPLADLVGFCDESRIEDWSITTELIRDEDEVLLETIPFDASRSVTNLERGDYTLRYIAEDLDGNQVERTCQMRVVDFQPPTAICNSSLTVMVDENVESIIYPEQLDNGSYDNCDTPALMLRRSYNPGTEDCHGDLSGQLGEWTDELRFECCDAGQTFPLQLRVMDTDSNENICYVFLTVMDDIAPVLSGLEAQTITCGDLPQNFEPTDSLQRSALFGSPQVTDNCAATIIEMEPELSWDNCQLGSITRKFMAADHAGNTSDGVYEQQIDIMYSNTYSIRFPKDAVTDCVAGVETLQFEGAGCGDFEVSFVDEDMEADGEACIRIQRTYTIINHCEYDGVSEPVALNRDEDCDATEGEDYLWLVISNGNAFADADNDAFNSVPAAGSMGTCGSNPAGYWRSLSNVGAWTYTQVIDISDEQAPAIAFDVPPVFCADEAACEGAVSLVFDVLEQCLPDRTAVRLFLDQDNDGTTDLDLTGTGVLSQTNQRYALDGNFPTGSHAFVLEAEDACGNIGTERIAFTVADCHIDQPACVGALEVQLSPVIPAEDLDGDGIIDEAAVVLDASALAEMSGLDCSGAYAYSVTDLGAAANFASEQLILTCEDRYQSILDVVVRDNANNPYAEQPDGTMGGPNYKRCTISISVQDPDEVCTTCAADDLEIEGTVRNRVEEPLSGVQMDIFVADELIGSALTITEGAYEFPELEFANTYRVRPYKNDDTANGVSTLDMIMLARHLAGQAVITDPYVLLAADIDANGVVDFADFNYMGDLMLDRLTAWPNNTSWRFIPATYELTDIAADIPDFIEYEDLSSCQFGQDFIGIKVGDINGSLTAAGALAQNADRHLGDWGLQLPAYQLRAGDLYRIPVRAQDLRLLSGLELELKLDLDALSILEIEEGLIGSDQINSSLLERGLLRAIWVKQQGLQTDEPLFTLVVEARTDRALAEVLTLTERGTARAYDQELTPFQLQLEFVDHGQEAVLLENRPDPFREATQIEFFLPNGGEYVLEITDTRGKVLRRYRQVAEAGRQQLKVFGNDLPAGVLFYTLTFNDRQLSRKMVKL